MLLGDLISRFDDETDALAALSALSDPRLLKLAQQAAAADGLPLGTWAKETVGRFAASADDERWLGLLDRGRTEKDKSRRVDPVQVERMPHPSASDCPRSAGRRPPWSACSPID